MSIGVANGCLGTDEESKVHGVALQFDLPECPAPHSFVGVATKQASLVRSAMPGDSASVHRPDAKSIAQRLED